MKKTYLAITAITLAIMGLVFALDPNRYLAGFGAALSTPGQLHVFRAFGGFYLGYAAFLLAAARKKSLADGAVLSAAIVMSGLLAGRLLSLFADGLPDPKLLVSAGIELLLAVGGLILTRTPKGPQP